MDKKEFLHNALQKDLTRAHIEQDTSEFAEEFEEEPKVKKAKARTRKKIGVVGLAVIVAVIVIVCIFVYAHFISSSFSSKFDMEKVILKQDEEIKETHISVLINELGGYKLHKSILTGKTPSIQLLFTDANKGYAITLGNKSIVTTLDEAKNPDIIITTTAKIATDVYKANNTLESAKSQFEIQKIRFEPQKSKLDLALKGYGAFLSTVEHGEDQGFKFSPAQTKLIYLGIVIILVIFCVWYLRRD